VATKSGGNTWTGSVFEYHRNEALDSPNYFDQGEKPDFMRNQFGATLGGPNKKDQTFFFLGYEGLRENLGKFVSTVVPDANARLGLLPNPANPGQLRNVGVNPAVPPSPHAYPPAQGPAADSERLADQLVQLPGRAAGPEFRGSQRPADPALSPCRTGRLAAELAPD